MSTASMRKVLDMIAAAGNDYYMHVLEARSEYLRLRLQGDRDIHRIYEQAVQEIADRLRAIGPGPLTPGGELVKRYYEELERAVRHQAEVLGRKLDDRIRGLIAETFDVASRPVVEMTSDLLGKAGAIVGLPFDKVKIQRGFAEVNTRAVEAYLAQTRHGLRISDRIWEIADGARDSMLDILRTSIAYGEDPVAVARRLEQYVREGAATFSRDYTSMIKRMKGRVRGNLCYEALRLARTEMSSAAMEAVYAAGAASPVYEGVKWILSNAHPMRDVCDDLAAADLFGLGPGVYKKGNEPPHPHPNCLCVVVPKMRDLDVLIQDLRAWRQDPESKPDLEQWYQKVYLGKSRMPRRSTAKRIAPKSKLEQILLEKEREIANLSYERCYLFDIAGTIIMTKDGTRNQISFSSEELSLFSGKISTHNHPSGSSFSVEDIYIAIRYNLQEIRAVGSKYRYAMQHPGKNWDQDHWNNEYAATISQLYNKLLNQYYKKLQAGKLTTDQANMLFWHELWTKVAKALGFKYTRTRW